MRAPVARQRTCTPGSTVDVAVLACGRRTTIGVDLDSGAFVRARESERHGLFAPYTVVRGVTAATQDDDRPEQPELVRVDGRLTVVDKLDRRTADRLVRPLLHPRHRSLLGFHGPSAPWWELEHHGSVAVVEPEHGPVALLDERGMRCHFVWSGQRHDLPLQDLRYLARLEWAPAGPVGPAELGAVLGFRPGRLVIALGRPHQGYCPKVVAGFLPRS